jgi:hypothetical protein
MNRKSLMMYGSLLEMRLKVVKVDSPWQVSSSKIYVIDLDSLNMTAGSVMAKYKVVYSTA